MDRAAWPFQRGETMRTDDLIYRSIYIITQYYKNDLEPFFGSISDDILWLGPAERQMIHGKQTLLQTFAREENNLTFTMGSIMPMARKPNSGI